MMMFSFIRGNSIHGSRSGEECAAVEVRKHQIDENKAVLIELEPNHASLHDGRLLHGSPSNTSNVAPLRYTMRYMPSSVKLSEETYATHNIYMARARIWQESVRDPTKSYEELAKYRRRSGMVIEAGPL